MKRITRRTFLRGVGGGIALAGVGVDRWMARALERPEAPVEQSLIPILSEIVADLERAFPYASALYTSADGVEMQRDRNGKNVSQSAFRGRGVSLRVWGGAGFREAAVSNLEPDALRASARRLAQDASREEGRFGIEPLPPLTREWRTEMQIDPAGVSLLERSQALDDEFLRVNWEDPRVKSAQVSTSELRVHRIFVDRNRRLSARTTHVAHNSFLFGVSEGRPAFATLRKQGQCGLERAVFTDAEIEGLRRELVEMFAAEPVPAGEYDVIFAPPVTGLLAHESFGHGVEMDLFVSERAKARHFLGKPVAAEIVSLLDDPTLPGMRGSYPFDDEGMVSEPTVVIRNGVFKSPLTDCLSATLLGRPRTANGRTQSYDRKVYARMSNTFIARGETDPEEMLAGLTDGFYIDGFRNGIEDPQGWGIQFTANVAREVKNGAFTGRLFAPVTVTGYVPEILSNITQVGSNFEIEPASCGKGFKEFVPVGSGGPSLRTRARIS